MRAQMKLFTLRMDPSKIDINRVREPDQSPNKSNSRVLEKTTKSFVKSD